VRGTRFKLGIMLKVTEYLSLQETIRLSYTCKRLYIILGDVRILSQFHKRISPRLTLIQEAKREALESLSGEKDHEEKKEQS
jgi:hypothetical protein